LVDTLSKFRELAMVHGLPEGNRVQDRIDRWGFDLKYHVVKDSIGCQIFILGVGVSRARSVLAEEVVEGMYFAHEK
jgi:hypothetical protein